MTMPLIRTLPLLLALACSAAAWAGDDEAWWSYRDAYRTLVRFDKQGQPKHLIQQQLQVQPLIAGAPTEGLQLRLQGSHTDLELKLDAALQTRVPLLKSAYDDNAALRLNRRAQAFGFKVRLSIVARADGVYPLGELRLACEQVLNAQLRLDPQQPSGRRCVGVSLAFGRDASPGVSWRQDGQSRGPIHNLTATPGPLYPGEAGREHQVVQLRWDGQPDTAQLLTHSTPLVIAALIE
ncbi:hypothetical protein RQP53_15405 [Paucibacter sp. APW11]|uniref:DUF3108 domain-containing protein n=1 Tax=Roseateles aquae TaxID=3077235 RepID=A0ABU3PFG6_9BURK|nr:hypothetical protein [Paucibacter sp. APW11]MDT9000661.1 hypothetical protein [Paucibacter sp. APW11]